MARRLDDIRLAVLMLDGIDVKGRTNIVALGITSQGVKIPLGLWEGSTENATVATALLSDLIERGLDTTQGVVCVTWWLQGAQESRARCLWRARSRTALHPSQGAQCPRSPAGA
jgi:transposase-like protein